MLAGALAGISETDSVGSDTFSDWETGAGGLSTAVWYGLSSCLFGTVKMVPDSEVLSFPPPDLEAFFSVVFVGGAVGVPLGGTVGVPLGGSAGVFVGGIVGASVGGAADVFVGGIVGASVVGSVGLESGLSPSSFFLKPLSAAAVTSNIGRVFKPSCCCIAGNRYVSRVALQIGSLRLLNLKGIAHMIQVGIF